MKLFTRRFALFVAIDVIGFASAIGLLFTDITWVIPAFLCSVTLGFGIWGALEAADGRL